jgi:glutathione S-transferase
MTERRYRLHGMTQSYFTRKVSGYLDYKGIPYSLRRFAGMDPDMVGVGWTGGIPVMQTPDGEYMWDSTALIEHLELHLAEPSVLPPDPVQRFLCYVLEDVADEWFYRLAVGSRWFFEENTRCGAWDLARELTYRVPASGDAAVQAVEAHMRTTCPPFGVTAENAGSWMDEILKPWLRVLGAQLEERPYLFGERPSLADFAIFGGNAAHFINDPLCRRWTDAEGPAIVRHTHRLCEAEDQTFGKWSDPGDLPETLVALLADLGRFYLPWVSRAVVDGEAELVFDSGQRITIGATEFLKEARGILLARYLQLRSEALDAVLERAGLLSYFADFTEGAGTIPSYREPPRPTLNRPFPPPGL